MSALFTALLEGESKESLAEMVCELRSTNARLSEALGEYMECVRLATDPATRNADAVTLVELQQRMTKARDNAQSALTTPSTGKG